ncbi:uncharacterized protein LOC126716717 isoform X2 [Quercus robur]|nr:uncharacterized protein LOC126716717 isoform X2 [Quercus robur]
MLHVSISTKLFCIPKSIGIFSNVETLELCFSQRMEFDALKVIAILKGFPLLKKFYMMMPCPNDFEQGMLEPNENVHELEHEHLKEVHLAEFYDTPNQINFSIYLIKHACALKEECLYHPCHQALQLYRHHIEQLLQL